MGRDCPGLEPEQRTVRLRLMDAVRTSRGTSVALFIAMLATAIALGGALAHVFALPNKIDLNRDAYFTVQQIYAGWSRFGYVLAVQFSAIVAVMVLSRNDRRVFWLAGVALVGLLAAQTVFWMLTQPANAWTENWTRQPDNWEELRTQWEYSHAAGALCQLTAMIALIVAALARQR